MEKTVTESLKLLERFAYQNFEWLNERGDARRTVRFLELDALSMINAQFDQLTKRVDRMQANIIGPSNQHYDNYGGHAISECNNYSEPFKEHVTPSL